MQVCTLLQTDNHTSTSLLSFFTGQMPFLPPNQQRQSTEGVTITLCIALNSTGVTRPLVFTAGLCQSAAFLVQSVDELLPAQFGRHEQRAHVDRVLLAAEVAQERSRPFQPRHDLLMTGHFLAKLLSSTGRHAR